METTDPAVSCSSGGGGSDNGSPAAGLPAGPATATDAKMAGPPTAEDADNRMVASLTEIMRDFSVTDRPEAKLDARTPTVVCALLQRISGWITQCNGVGRSGWIRLRDEAEEWFSEGWLRPKEMPAYALTLALRFKSLAEESDMYVDARELRDHLAEADAMIADARALSPPPEASTPPTKNKAPDAAVSRASGKRRG